MSRNSRTPRTPRMPAPSSGLLPRVEPLTGPAITSEEQGRAAVEPATTTTAATPAAASTKRSGRSKSTTTRSWYLATTVADELSTAAEDIYHDLRGRQDKATILGALIRGGLDNLPAVRRSLGLDS